MTHRHMWLDGSGKCMGCGASRYQAIMARGAETMAPSWAEWHALTAERDEARRQVAELVAFAKAAYCMADRFDTCGDPFCASAREELTRITGRYLA